MGESSTELPLILLAEDDHTIAYVVQRVLEDQQRFRVTWVKDGEAALEAAEAECPALFLLDLMMPRRNGFEVCRRLRADDRFKDLPICILTALTDPQAHQAALDAGANLLLLKPFRSQDLREAVKGLLESESKENDPAAQAAVASSAESVPQLLKLVAHDMRGPLTVFNSSLSFLDSTTDPAERLELIESLQDASQRLTSMVDAVVGVSEREELDKMPRDSRIDLCSIVRSVVAEYKVAFKAREVELEAQIPDLAIECIGNESLLRCAITNAVLNAADYSPLGGKARVVVVRDRGECAITISDEGPGIPAQVVDRLFETSNLVSLKSEGIRVGKGLGLVLVRRICHLHQGYVDVRTSAVGGTDLTLSFPTAQATGDQGIDSGAGELRVPIRIRMILKKDNVSVEVFTKELGRLGSLVDAGGANLHGSFEVRLPEFPTAFATARVLDDAQGGKELQWSEVNAGFHDMLDQIYRTVPGANLLS